MHAELQRYSEITGWSSSQVLCVRPANGSEHFEIASPVDLYVQSVAAAAWSPDGSHVVTASGNNECALRLYDVLRRVFVSEFGCHGDNLYALDWSSDGHYIVTASTCYDSHIKAWEVDWGSDIFGPKVSGIRQRGARRTCGDYPLAISASGVEPPPNHWCCYGFSHPAVRPGSTSVAATMELRYRPAARGPDAYASIPALLSLPGLEEVERWDRDAGVTALAWTSRGELLSIEGLGVRSRLPGWRGEVAPYWPAKGAEWIGLKCHPIEALCAVWDHRGGIEIRELARQDVVTARGADGPSDFPALCDVRWSRDGRKLYAASRRGRLIVCTVA